MNYEMNPQNEACAVMSVADRLRRGETMEDIVAEFTRQVETEAKQVEHERQMAAIAEAEKATNRNELGNALWAAYVDYIRERQPIVADRILHDNEAESKRTYLEHIDKSVDGVAQLLQFMDTLTNTVKSEPVTAVRDKAEAAAEQVCSSFDKWLRNL